MRSKERGVAAGLFAGIFAAEFAVGYYYASILLYMHSDAMSRVANAFYVLYSRDPHLAAIGFVWNPLPSLVDLVVLLLYPIFPALASEGLAGVCMSAGFAALTGVLLYKAGRDFSLSRTLSITITLLFCLNPLIFYFGFTGLSDAPFIYFTMYAFIAFLYWMKEGNTGSLVKSSLALALAFWTRYEAVPIGVALAAAAVIWVLLLLRQRKAHAPLGYRLHHVGATWAVLLAPAVYSGVLWLVFNYIIMGNPLYFLNSEYSNLAQASPLLANEAFAEVIGHPFASLWLVIQKTSYFTAPLLAILLARLFDRRLLQWDTMIVLLAFAAVPALQLLLLYKGASFAWFRYFMYGMPLTVAWLVYEMSQARRRRLVASWLITGLIVNGGLMGYAISQPDIAADEHTTITLAYHYEAQLQDREVADYLDEHYPKASILVDSYSAYVIIVNSHFPKRFLITSDRNFRLAVSHPWDFGVKYILLPQPTETAPLSTINVAYPNLFEQGAEWAEQVEELAEGRWRLYRIVPPNQEKGIEEETA